MVYLAKNPSHRALRLQKSMDNVCPEEGTYILGECLPPILTLVVAFVGPFWVPKWLNLAIYVRFLAIMTQLFLPTNRILIGGICSAPSLRDFWEPFALFTNKRNTQRKAHSRVQTFRNVRSSTKFCHAFFTFDAKIRLKGPPGVTASR